MSRIKSAAGLNCLRASRRATEGKQWDMMRAMRLLDSQIASIRTIVPQYAGQGCRVYLFGSRLDDAARGGDVDLLIETPQQLPLMQRVRMKMAIEAALGLPVDLVVREENQTPTAFQRLAKLRSTPLMDEGA